MTEYFAKSHKINNKNQLLKDYIDRKKIDTNRTSNVIIRE